MTDTTPAGPMWSVQQQIIEDPASGLTFQFEVMPDGEPRMRVFGNLPLGNREFIFNREGKKVGSGTYVQGLCKPTWTMEIEPND